MVYLHALSLEVARVYAAELGLRDWHYISSADLLRGVAHHSVLLVLPSASSHPFTFDFTDAARESNMRILYVNEDYHKRHGNG